MSMRALQSYRSIGTILWRSRLLKPSLLVLCLLLVLLDAWALNSKLMGSIRLQWGSAGEWVSGIGTVAAVIVALRESSVARYQARLDKLCSVGGWMEIRRQQNGTPYWEITLLNSTDFPIYKWYAEPVGELSSWHLCSSVHGSLVPGSSNFEFPGYHGSQQANSVPLQISFQDRDGGIWTREPGGRLINSGSSALDNHLTLCQAQKGSN